MLKNFIYIILLLGLISASGVATGQTLYYDVVKGSKTLGEMIVVRTENEDTVTYEIVSDVELRLLFSFRVKYFLEEEFVNGQLTNGRAYNTLNEKMQKQSVVQNDGHRYVINLNGELINIDSPPSDYSVSKLYFEKPTDQNIIFSQQFAEFLPISQTAELTFELESPEGKNYYHYNADGICDEVKVSRTYATFYFKLREKSASKINIEKYLPADLN